MTKAVAEREVALDRGPIAAKTYEEMADEEVALLLGQPAPTTMTVSAVRRHLQRRGGRWGWTQ